MHNVLIISYIAFPIGKLFILPESEKVRRFLYRELPYRTRSERPMRSTVVDLMPFRRQMFVTVVP